MQTAVDELELKAQSAGRAARRLATLGGGIKDDALSRIADGLVERQEEILAANSQDLEAGQQDGVAPTLLGRLALDAKRLDSMAGDVRRIASLPDPVGETIDMRTMPNGLRVGRRRVPLGVIGTIYESRPNVTIDIAALCFKSGNAVILRGGREAIRSNTVLANLVRDGISRAGVPQDAVQFIESSDRALVGRMLRMSGQIDLIIPRGGAELIRRVAAEATMPAITGGIGVCNTYVDRAADLDMAVAITNNAKISAPYVCNALDTVLVHAAVAPAFLRQLGGLWADAGVEMVCDRRALTLLAPIEGAHAAPADDEDWGTEFLALKAAVKIVDSIDEALEHIDAHGSGHSEAIVTEDYSAATRFVDEVDSAAVFVNASTRFNDGAEFGLGAEVAISTNKMHARGPMGLRELTSYKWTVLGTGQVRE